MQSRVTATPVIVVAKEVVFVNMGIGLHDCCGGGYGRWWRHFWGVKLSLLALGCGIESCSFVGDGSCYHRSDTDRTDAGAPWGLKESVPIAVEVPICGRKWRTCNARAHWRLCTAWCMEGC